MQKTPTHQEILSTIGRGASVALEAREVRVRERGHKRLQRRANLDEAIQRCSAVAATLRSYIGMCFAHPIDEQHEQMMKGVVSDLDRERRKLRKMLNR